NQKWKNQNNYSVLNEISNYPKFDYIWVQRIENVSTTVIKIEKVYFPWGMLEEKFRNQIEGEFWSKFFNYYENKQHLLVGDLETVTSKFRDFQKKLDKYISKVEAKIKPFSNKTVDKKDGDKHFRWLIEYQISPIKSYNRMSKEQGVDRRTIMDGIKNVSDLLGLTLRPPTKGGRAKNVKDLIPRQERRSKNT
ncbi:MAG: hypothetical protein M3Q99_19045, partial [Acidobacteriota bacterium]|nr:hypothetical protein [Acidobacteriota bacterium]